MTGAAAIVTAAFLEPPRAGKSVKDLAEGGGGSFGFGPPAPPERQEEARGGIPEDSNAEEEEEEDRLEANAAEKLILTNNPSFELFAALGQK
jgi:hypothetical protein